MIATKNEGYAEMTFNNIKTGVKSLQCETTKVFNCLIGVVKLIERHGVSIDHMLQEVVNALPPSWQYPEVTCGRITFKNKEYTTPNFKISKWPLIANIIIDDKKVGSVEIYYRENMPNIDEGPFFKEERLLIDTVAENIGNALERIQLKHFVQEKVKELSCLYMITKLIEKHSTETDKILQGVVVILTESLLYPEITRVRIILDREEYVTENFSVSQWKQHKDIIVGNHTIGVLEVYYLEEMPFDEEPFLKEEYLLITSVAERIGRTIARIRAEHQLKVERSALESKNVALHELVEMVQREKDYVGVSIQSNVDKIIMPIIYAIENEIPQSQLVYVELLKKNLKEIASPFINTISNKYSSLTPVEIQICDLIKNGFVTKDIARIREISTATVNRHREHIRKKLGISNQKINLTTYLNSFIKKDGVVKRPI